MLMHGSHTCAFHLWHRWFRYDLPAAFERRCGHQHDINRAENGWLATGFVFEQQFRVIYKLVSQNGYLPNHLSVCGANGIPVLSPRIFPIPSRDSVIHSPCVGWVAMRLVATVAVATVAVVSSATSIGKFIPIFSIKVRQSRCLITLRVSPL